MSTPALARQRRLSEKPAFQRHGARMRHFAPCRLLLPVVALLPACATTQLLPHDYLQSRQTVTVQSVSREHDDAHPSSKSGKAAKGAALGGLKGAGAGLGVCANAADGGGQVGAVIFLMCSVIALPIGLVAGSVGGAAEQAKTGLSHDEVKQFKAVLDSAQHAQSLSSQFDAHFKAAAARHRTLVETGADLPLELHWQELEFVLAKDKLLGLKLGACVRFQQPMAQRSPKRHKLCSAYASNVAPVDDWLAEDGAKFRGELSTGIETLALSLNDSLWAGTVPTVNGAAEAASPKATDEKSVVPPNPRTSP
jgi:hypothetical protein